MNDIVDKLQELRKNNRPVPGLSSSGKDFYVYIDCEQGHPVLVPPLEI